MKELCRSINSLHPVIRPLAWLWLAISAASFVAFVIRVGNWLAAHNLLWVANLANVLFVKKNNKGTKSQPLKA